MTIREAKNWGIRELRRTDREAAIDAEILLSHCLGITREEALAHDERRVPSPAAARFRRLIARRAKHEPTAYLIGHREFFGLKFAVNRRVLIPRPETEMLVEEVLARTPRPARGGVPLFPRGASTKPPFEKGRVGRVLVIDVGTGSGAIAIAVAKNSDATIIATDASKGALKVAELNAAMNGVEDRIDFMSADLLVTKRGHDPFFPFKLKTGHVPFSTIIAANLPYIPTADWRKCMPDVKDFEPRSALDGGPDGLRLYDRLFHQIIGLGLKPTAIVCEIDPGQKRSLPKLAKKHFPTAKTEIKNDLANLARIATISF
jgi:release factor glutamine methyltransferase